MENVVGFVGYECEDIAIYIAKILHALGKTVAVVDRTEQELLCEIFDLRADSEKTWKEGEYSGVLITNRGVNQKDYDYVFYLFGYRLNHPKLYECKKLIMVTDGVPAHASLLKMVENWECKRFLLIRNLVPMKHTEAYLASLTGKEDEFREIAFDEKDIRSRCSMGAYTGCEVKNLSAGMKRVLVFLVCNLNGEYGEKRVREQIKKL